MDVDANDYVFVRGMRATRGNLARWNANPGPVLASWVGGALAVAIGLLAAVVVVAEVATPHRGRLDLPGLTSPPDLVDVGTVLGRNGLVLALHAGACVAGFIAGGSLPLAAERQTGFSRWMHERARPVAFAWVVLVTCFSLATQAFYLGQTGATLSAQLGISKVALIASVLPHALPELVALFLPLAAWMLASRQGEWESLLAATLATVAIAIPVLVVAATWEVYVWPHILAALSPVA
jgi:hypothetical protein